MALPKSLEPHVGRIEGAIRNLVEAVYAAQYDRRSNESDPDSGLSVGEARALVDTAMQNWRNAAEAFQAALDTTERQQPEAAPHVQAARGTLSKLHFGVGCEVALVQELDTLDQNAKLAAVPNWPTPGTAVLEEAAFGSARNSGLIGELRDGTDDDPERERPGQLNNLAVENALKTIRRQTADATISVFVGLAAVPVAGLIPLPDGVEVAEKVRDLLEEPASWAIEKVVKELPRGVSKWVQWALGKAAQLLNQLLGEKHLILPKEIDDFLTKAAANSGADLITRSLMWVYDTEDVFDRASAAFDPPGHPLSSMEQNNRGTRLRKLEQSNKKWLLPIRLLSPGLGNLWGVPIPLPVPIPAAPAGAALLLAWTLVLAGDQLDSRYPYPNIWKGVVRRAGGE